MLEAGCGVKQLLGSGVSLPPPGLFCEGTASLQQSFPSGLVLFLRGNGFELVRPSQHRRENCRLFLLCSVHCEILCFANKSSFKKKNPNCAVGWFVLKTEGQSHLGSRNSPLTFCPLPVSRLLVFWCVVVCCSFPSLLEPDPSGQSLCEVYLTKKPEFLVVSPLSSFSKFH